MEQFFAHNNTYSALEVILFIACKGEPSLQALVAS
jgi:hypothetical protein